jgi:hypothetical protein
MKQLKLTKDQIQKVILSVIGFIVLVYVYFSFFLGPLNRSRDTMLVTINEVQGKIDSSKNEITKASNLEKQATSATTRFAALKSLSPEGAPIAWFPPRMKTFFANQQLDKATARLENSGPYKEADLANWMRHNWLIELPQADFSTLGNAVAALENSEPLLSITRINIRAVPDDQQFQRVSLSASSAILKQ